MGRLRFWMESLTAVELGRVADATAWDKEIPWHGGGYSGAKVGCLLCHATGNDYDSVPNSTDGSWNHAKPSVRAELRYMDYARVHGEYKAGQLMQSFARAILARRKLAAYPVHEKPLPSIAQLNGAHARELAQQEEGVR